MHPRLPRMEWITRQPAAAGGNDLCSPKIAAVSVISWMDAAILPASGRYSLWHRRHNVVIRTGIINRYRTTNWNSDKAPLTAIPSNIPLCLFNNCLWWKIGQWRQRRLVAARHITIDRGPLPPEHGRLAICWLTWFDLRINHLAYISGPVCLCVHKPYNRLACKHCSL